MPGDPIQPALTAELAEREIGSDRRRGNRSPFPIVGIGGSAGGIEAITELLKGIPADTGMAFLLVLHLDPHHESSLKELFGRATPMPVEEARNRRRVEPNRVYVIPPNTVIELKSGCHLRVSRRQDGGSDRTPVDALFRSMAVQAGPRAIGVVLSGNGADGTAGLTAIKCAGGVTFAQSETSAKFGGMPASAVAAGCVDRVLTIPRLASELAWIGRRLGKNSSPKAAGKGGDAGQEKPFEEILHFLRRNTAVDFTQYKHATLRRRIERRQMLQRLDSLEEYSAYLHRHPAEIKELFNDVLIHVTGFFRDRAVFQALRRKILPRLLRQKRPEDGIRIWIPGCSSGEEVYSLAIVLSEAMSEKGRHPVQIFGTDINEVALEKARAGIYSEASLAEVDPERRRRYFARCEEGYRASKTIREMCIFARQNLTADPPFSNLDLISCRNVLIYLGPLLQRRVLPIFHYALRPSGLLMLGAAESVGGFGDLFFLLDKKAKIYAKRQVTNRPVLAFVKGLAAGGDDAEPPADRAAPVEIRPAGGDVQKQADRLILADFGPPGVVVNGNLEVLQFRGRTNPYFEHPHGEASLNLFKIAKAELILDLRAVLNKAIRQNLPARREHVRLHEDGQVFECAIKAVPFGVAANTERFYLVLFERSGIVREDAPRSGRPRSAHARRQQEARLGQLQEELASLRESMQAVIEGQEATNEELRSANEEIMSSNEELQSTNEELETAKEELQSTNEELTTLNDELESRNAELQQVNNDLHNLLASVSIPVIILSSELRIRRFTAAAERILKLIPGDLGRPITDINMPLEIPNLGSEVTAVLDSLAPKDLELRDKQGHLWSVRIRAYKTMENKIDGAVLAMVDLDALRARKGWEA